MRTRLSIISILAAVASMAAAASQGPEPQEPAAGAQPVFRSESNFIRVDMYPTRDGEFVTDVTPEDVEVLEDGVRQKIETFERVHIPTSAEGRAASAADPAVVDPRSRVYVVFIDTYTTELDRAPALRLSLVRFLDRLLGPGDLVALMTPEMKASDVVLGTRATVISDLANDARWARRAAPERENLKEFAWENCYPSRNPFGGRASEMKARQHARLTIEALDELVGHLRLLREERKAVLFVTAGWPFIGDSLLYNDSRDESPACQADRQMLVRTNFPDMLRDLARSANRANVSFYPVNSRQSAVPANFEPMFRGGVAINGAMLRQRERQVLDRSQEHLRTLAEDTDGLAQVGVANLDHMTDRIVADTSSYYLIGYQSTNPRADGRYRSITVKVRRDGVRVRARAGYGGDAPVSLRTEAPGVKTPVVDNRVSVALDTVERFDTAAPLWLRAASWATTDEAGDGAFWFTGEVGAQLRTQRPWTAGTTAVVEVLNSDRSQVLTRAFELTSANPVFAMRVPETGELPPGDYAVRVKIAPSHEEGTAIHDATRVTLDRTASDLGGAVLWRRGASARLGYLQTADPRFRRTERLRLELPTISDAAASARILDRLGQPLPIPLQVTERADAAGGMRWVVVDAPLTGLAPGDYAIDVSRGGTSQLTAFRIIP